MRSAVQRRSRYIEFLEKKGILPPHEDEMEGVDDEIMGPENNFDYEMGHADDYDSSGEPNTEDDLESERPMEYMNRGGMVRRMFKGGKVPSRSFAKALRKSY